MLVTRLRRRSPKVLVKHLSAGITARGPQILVEALCRKYDVWASIMRVPFPNSSEARDNLLKVAQLLYSFTSGGCTLFEAGALMQDPLFLNAVGLDSPVGEDALREWLQNQNSESVTALREVNLQMIRRAAIELLDSGVWDIDLAELSIERPAPTVEAYRLPSIWQMISIGNFVMDCGWRHEEDEGSTWKDKALHNLLEAQQEFPKDSRLRFWPTDVYEIESIGRSMTTSTSGLWAMQVAYAEVARIVDRSPPKAWKKAPAGDSFADEYGIFYPPGVGRLIAARRLSDQERAAGKYLFVHPALTIDPAAAFKQWHVAPRYSRPMDDLKYSLRLARMPFAKKEANEVWFTIAALAYNLLSALRATTLPMSYNELPIASIINRMLQFPATLKNPRNRPQLRLFVPPDWSPRIQKLVEVGIGDPKRGRRPGSKSVMFRQPSASQKNLEQP